jgi:threonine aldolase
VARAHQAHRFQPAERGAQREPIHPERERQLTFRRKARPGGDSTGKDLVPKPIRDGIDDARASDRTDRRERVRGMFGRARFFHSIGPVVQPFIQHAATGRASSPGRAAAERKKIYRARPLIDLRSDTVTRPTPAMREAMAQADVGDDVFGEDPTVRELEAEIARVTGKEAAVFVTSGTMGNQLAIALQTRPGDEVIVGEGAHVVFYESGAGPALSGVQFAIAGSGGLFDAEAMEERIQAGCALVAPVEPRLRREHAQSRRRTRVPAADRDRDREPRPRPRPSRPSRRRPDLECRAASGLDVAELARPFDTVSVCFSKGLGAPVGARFAAAASSWNARRTIRNAGAAG